MRTEAYLFFEGRCEEAIEFYRGAVGAEVTMMMRFGESPDPSSCGSVDKNKILHASFKIGETNVLVSDGNCSGKTCFGGFALSIALDDVSKCEQMYNALADGGQPFMPLAKTFFSEKFGMLTDRFGVTWMLMVHPK